MKINIGKPDINKSFSDFTIESYDDNKISFGLSSIKNVGHGVVEMVIKERNEHGLFKNFIEFCSRVDPRVANKKTLESLIVAGAFDSLESNRRKLYENHEIIINKFGNKKLALGQSSLFTGDHSTESQNFAYNKPDWSDREKLSYEKSVLGIYLSSHPLADYEFEINKLSNMRFGDVELNEEGVAQTKLSVVRMCGIINNLKVKQSKRGNRFATFTLEDFTGQGECVVFPKVYENNKEILQNENIVSITGKPEENGTGIKIIVDEIKPLVKINRARLAGDSNNSDSRKLMIKLNESNFSEDIMMKFKSMFKNNSGNCIVYFNIFSSNGIHSLMKIENFSIFADTETMSRLSEMFGQNNVSFI
jgi:DNA polymerase-3 subunit alpha